MYGHERNDDTACANICTGLTITFHDCPSLCISKLPTETALSKMEAEIIALAHFCWETFLIFDITRSLGKTVGLPVGLLLMKVSVCEDNYGALLLARTFPQKCTPHMNYYATKTIWFREEINKRKIALLKMATTEHLGDLFTKGLPRATFEYLQNEIMGWPFSIFFYNIMFERECGDRSP